MEFDNLYFTKSKKKLETDIRKRFEGLGFLNGKWL